MVSSVYLILSLFINIFSLIITRDLGLSKFTALSVVFSSRTEACSYSEYHFLVFGIVMYLPDERIRIC